MKILFIGEIWLGSCARSIKEALARNINVEIDEVAEDSFFLKSRAKYLRIINRILLPLYRRDFNQHVLNKIRVSKPEVVLIYKGSSVHRNLVNEIRRMGPLVANIYPDCSPHAHGAAHKEAIGSYDLVVSTKAYHPELWTNLYGYHNQCGFVPQGYDPLLHLVNNPPTDFQFDIALVATFRPEYAQLMIDFAKILNDEKISVVIGGYGWSSISQQLPTHWVYTGAVQGRGYISLLRSAKICIAPLTRDVVINGQIQPGDVDSTRTYELAAAHCFFIHRRTDFIKQLYGDVNVPMFDDAYELARHVRYYLEHDIERENIALAVHRKAVPALSNDARANEIVSILQSILDKVKLSA